MLRTYTEAAADYCAAAKKRAEQGGPRMLLLGALAGMFIAFAGVGASLGGALAGKIASAAIFPTGLAMVLLAGSELFTGNCLLLMPLLRGDVTGGRVLRNWLLVYAGNFFGSLLIAFLAAQCGVLDGIADAVVGTAVTKAALPTAVAFLRGVLCNFLVCLAVRMAFCARSAGGKMVSLFGPIFLFVLCGFEHSVANMYYIPAGIFLAGNGELSWLDLLRNLLPVTLGNLVGGCALGGILYLLYARKAG